MRSFFVLLLCLGSTGALAADDGIRFDAVITHKGAVVSAPSLAIGFGQEGNFSGRFHRTLTPGRPPLRTPPAS
jgi:hypothetical protein